MFANTPNAPRDSSRRLRQRGPQQLSFTQNVEDELDSGYDGEDNLEPKRNDHPSAPSPESYFTSADNDEVAIPVEPDEPVARKRARQACDHCRAKKCRARPTPDESLTILVLWRAAVWGMPKGTRILPLLAPKRVVGHKLREGYVHCWAFQN
jgi:hypothetical protein